MPPPVHQQPSNGMATSGMVLGIIAAALSIIPIISIVALPVAVVGLPLAGVGFAKSRNTGVGKGASIAGIATNLAALAIWGLWAFVWGAAMAGGAA